MKRFILMAAAAALLAIPAAEAQKVNKEATLSKLEKSDADIANPKKNAKAATWINRGRVYYDAAAEPTAERPDPDDGLPEKKTLDYRTLPDAIKPAYRKTVEIYRAMRSLHEKMKLVKSDSQREQVRDRLLTLDKERAAMWEIIDRWRQDGVLPNPPEDELLPSDPKSVAAARVSITRNLALLEKTTEQKRIDALVERLRRPVAIVKASGGTFTDKAGILSKYGLI